MSQSFECGICGYRRTFEDVIRVYDTPDQVGVIAWPCWCWECAEVSLAEYIPSPSEIIEEAKAWSSGDRQREYRVTGPPYGRPDAKREQAVLGYLDAVLVWRRQRRSGGRCLFCGSVMVSLAESRYDKFEHPSCGGMLCCYLSIFAGIRRMTKEVYSSEGHKLSEEQVVA